MSCAITRIDDQNFNLAQNVNPAHSVYDSARGKVYFVYCDRRTSRNDTALKNTAIVFREWDVATEAFAAAVVIDVIPAGAAEDTDLIDTPSFIRLTSGTLIVAYQYAVLSAGLLNQTRVKESTDNGATWSAAVLMDSGVSSTRLFVDLGTDGTNVFGFTYQQGGGTGGQNLWVWRRTGIGTWSSGVVVYDGHVAGPSAGEMLWQLYGGKHMVIVKDATTALIVIQRSYSATQMRVSGFRTTDSGATWSEVVIYDMGVTSTEAAPITYKGTDNRIRTMLLKTNPAYPTRTVPVLCYSDDYGLTWATIGTPSVLSIDDGQAWHKQNKGFLLGTSNNMVLSTWRQNLGAGLWTIQIFGGGDTLANWTELATCDIGSNPNSNLVGDSLLIGADYLQVLDPIPSPPGTYYSLAYLRETGIDTPGTTGPPLVHEASSGFDVSNMYLRLQVAKKRGWGLHDLEVSCWSPWGEGTYLSQRRDHVLLAGAAVIDPTTGDPADLPAIWQVDNKERFTKETFITDGTNIIPRGDPFRFYWKSRGVELNDKFGQGVLRGFMFRYRRTGGTFTVNVLVDGATAMTQSMRASLASMDDIIETFIPARTDDNVGTYVQLLIDDESEYPLIIEGFVPVRIRKGLRG